MIDKNNYYYFEFHKRSSIEKPLELLPSSKWPESWKRIYFKGYPRFERFHLDKFSWLDNHCDLIKTIVGRRSSRSLGSKREISKDDISLLLLAGAITKVDGDVYYDSYRAYPSAGARFPLEIYVLVNNSKDFKRGIYHYHVRTHSLEFLWTIDKKDIKGCFTGQAFVAKSKLIFIISAIMNRCTVKYLERGYRLALLEAGHLAQNICLLAQAKSMNICPIGGFNDKKLAQILEFDTNEELVLYTLALS